MSFEAEKTVEDAFIDEKELLRRIPVSRRTLFAWRRAGKLSSIQVSGRRLLFHWPTVRSALIRQQRGGTD